VAGFSDKIVICSSLGDLASPLGDLASSFVVAGRLTFDKHPAIKNKKKTSVFYYTRFVILLIFC